VFGTFFDKHISEINPPIMQVKTFVPTEYILQVMEMSKEVFNTEEELEFLKSCLFYLNEGMTAINAIEMSMVDYLVDM
jgi:translation elongation factor EF-4